MISHGDFGDSKIGKRKKGWPVHGACLLCRVCQSEKAEMEERNMRALDGES